MVRHMHKQLSLPEWEWSVRETCVAVIRTTVLRKVMEWCSSYAAMYRIFIEHDRTIGVHYRLYIFNLASDNREEIFY